MTEEKNIIAFECPLSFSLLDREGIEISKGKARAQVGKEKLSLFLESGNVLIYPLREIVEIDEGDYQLNLDLIQNEKLLLSHVGFKYEDFYRELSKARNELILQDMLVKEKVKKKDIEGDFSFFNQKGEKQRSGKCESRIFETSLVVIPIKGEILRFPLGNLKEIQLEDYSIVIMMDSGEKLIMSKLGCQLDPFKKVLSEVMNKLSQKTQVFLNEMLPQSDSTLIRKLSLLMKEGKVARRKDIDDISGTLWTQLEEQIALSPLWDTYQYLRSLGNKEKLAVGFKRGLMGGMNNDYLWLLVPIFGNKPGDPGNVVVMEAGVIKTKDPSLIEENTEEEPMETDESVEAENKEESEEVLKQEGKATYFFRITGRESFAAMKDKNVLSTAFDEFIFSFNRSMQEINFRREPIYMDEKKLSEPKNMKYNYAIKRLPELRYLRSLFIGRVMHRTPDQWRNDTMDLLKFNTTSQKDSDKWEKGG